MQASRTLAVAVALFAGAPLAVHARSNSSTDPTDQAFMQKAAAGGLMEVQLGQLAQQKAQSDAVKAFGQRMIEDHTKANDQLQSIAQQENVALSTDLKGEQKQMVDRLSKLQGAEFDRQYMSAMVRDHTEDVQAFERQAKRPSESPVKQFAASTLPTLKEHLQLAKQTQAQVGGAGGTTRHKPATHQM